jgi:peptidyl-dipeptidase Dcp
MAPKLAASSDEIFLNTKLFQRVQTVYNKRNTLALDQESMALLELTHRNFVLAGAQLDSKAKEQMKKLNE